MSRTTIGELKRATLQLMDEFSENGYLIGEGNPVQGDFLLRMHEALNQGLMRIIVKEPIIKEFPFGEGEPKADGVHYPLPGDFMRIYAIRSGSEREWWPGEYAILGSDLIVPAKEHPMVYYAALPKRIGMQESDEEVLEISEGAARLLPLFMAGMLWMEENPALSARFMNQFEGSLAELPQQVVVG